MMRRQPDGKMKLEADGWTEDSMTEIEFFIGDKYMKLGEWITDDFFPRLREERYNPVHVRMTGTSMASRENYFPMVIAKSEIREKGELGETIIGMPSTITGNIINRTINTLKVDTKLRKGSPGQSLQAILAEMNALYTQTVDANLDNVFGAWVFNSYEFQNIKDNPEKVKARLAQFTPGIQAHPMLKKSQDASQATARSAVGQPYTDFSCKNTAGETIALSSLTGPGRWVLLDFWATWCTPCMNEVPHLKKAYETFHAKGFEIYGVSLENK